MPQLNLYIDDELRDRLREAAEREQVSQSQFVAELIRRATSAQWPAAVWATFGAFPDFPSAEEFAAWRQAMPEDPPRDI
jgi:hypothetical protein